MEHLVTRGGGGGGEGGEGGAEENKPDEHQHENILLEDGPHELGVSETISRKE